MKRIALALLWMACASALAPAAFAQRGSFSASELAERTLHRRAVEAVIWGMPIVNYDMMFQALLRTGEGGFNQIVYWSRLPGWKNQTLTPDGDALTALPFVNTKEAGPVVIEIPPADDVSISGTVMDAWQVALEEVGPSGADKGKGGKYVVLPPGYKDKTPDGYIALPSNTYRSYALLRAVPRSDSAADVDKAAAHLKRIRVYPLSEAASPPATKFIDVADAVFDSTIPYDLRFFQSLDRMVQAEPWQARDKAMSSLLRSIGIEKDKPFAPDMRTAQILEAAAFEAHAWLEHRFLSAFQPFYPDARWFSLAEPVTMTSPATFELPDLYDTDARGTTFAYTSGNTRNSSAGPFQLLATRDRNGELLDGGHDYRLTLPPNAPVTRHWSAAAYDLETGAFIRDVLWPCRASFTEALQKNADGSVDLYFGPEAPGGKEANWIPTRAGQWFFVALRFHGPQKPLLEKAWQLPDIEPTN